MSAVLEHEVLYKSEELCSGSFKLGLLPVMTKGGGISSSPPPLLRLGFPDATLPVAEGTPYGSVVKRAARLPAVKTKCKEKSVKKMFLAMMNGSIQGTYKCSKKGTYPFETTFTLEFGLADDENTPQDLQGTLMGVEVLCSQNFTPGKRRESILRTANNCHNKKFGSYLRPTEKEYLAHRAVHFFFRALASELPFVFVSDAVMVLYRYYSAWKYFADARDAEMIKSDVAISMNNRDTDMIAFSLIKVGECFEALEEDFVAALIYEQIANSYGATMDVCPRIHHFAGLAFRNSGKFSKAEEHLVRGWYRCCTDSTGMVNLNEEIFTDIITTMLIMYDMIAESGARQGNHGLISTSGQRVHPILCGLLCLAGFRAGHGGRSKKMVYEMGAISVTRMLKQTLNQQSALRILVEAADPPSPESFRQKILRAQDSHSIVSHYSEFSSDDPFYKSNVTGNEHLRKQLSQEEQKHLYTTDRCLACGVMNRLEGALHTVCSCKNAVYCSKECQKKHWKEHKLYCTVRLQQKDEPKTRCTMKNCMTCDMVSPPGGKPHSLCSCKKVVYCSRVCQKKHWKEHKQYCAFGKEGKENGGESKAKAMTNA